MGCTPYSLSVQESMWLPWATHRGKPVLEDVSNCNEKVRRNAHECAIVENNSGRVIRLTPNIRERHVPPGVILGLIDRVIALEILVLQPAGDTIAIVAIRRAWNDSSQMKQTYFSSLLIERPVNVCLHVVPEEAGR